MRAGQRVVVQGLPFHGQTGTYMNKKRGWLRHGVRLDSTGQVVWVPGVKKLPSRKDYNAKTA